MRLLLAFGLLLLARPARAAEAEVIVYGATPGGFCAAIAAAREGASVVLLEPTAHVGGVNTGGLSFSDSNQTVRSTLLGLFEEWHQRVADDYAARGVKLPYDVAVKDNSVWTYEPHVAARVTDAMLKEAGVTVLTKQPLESIEKEGTKIVSLRTPAGVHTAKIFIDATYEGDLLAKSGVVWHLGRESRDEYGESLAGRQYPKQKMEINGFDANGLPLPFITTVRKGDDQEGEQSVMVYSFRLCLTKDPANRVAFPAPKAKAGLRGKSQSRVLGVAAPNVAKQARPRSVTASKVAVGKSPKGPAKSTTLKTPGLSDARVAAHPGHELEARGKSVFCGACNRSYGK